MKVKNGKGKQKQSLRCVFTYYKPAQLTSKSWRKKNELEDEVIAKVKQPGNMILFFKILNLNTAIFHGRNGQFQECKSESLRMSRNELI